LCRRIDARLQSEAFANILPDPKKRASISADAIPGVEKPNLGVKGLRLARRKDSDGREHV